MEFLWYYNKDKINEKFYFANNLTENINKYLNKNLKRAKYSRLLFRECILKIILQFSNKTINKYIDKNKTELLKFYINKINNIELLNSDEIDRLRQEYDEIKFLNINSSYCEVTIESQILYIVK